MSDILGDDKRRQIVALGRVGWSLSRIEHAQISARNGLGMRIPHTAADDFGET